MSKPVTALKIAIVTAGRNQREIAAKTGISEKQMSLIVNGYHASPDLRTRIAAELGRDEQDLFPQLGDAA